MKNLVMNKIAACWSPLAACCFPFAACCSLLAALLLSCSDQQDPSKAGYESAIQGSITVLIDPEYRELMDTIQTLYAKEHPKAVITFKEVVAGDAMMSMLNRTERIAIVARNYTPAEEDVRLAAGADSLPRALLSVDALVVLVPKSFPYDTMNAEHIRGWLSGDATVTKNYPKLAKTPQFVVPGGADASIYGNVVNVVLRGKQPAKGAVATVGTRDSLKQIIASRPGDYIGFGLLSQYVRDSSVKMLRLSYMDSTGAHVWPKPVHSSYLMMRKYPFPVPVYVYLKRAPSQRDLASGYMQFVTRSGKVQKLLFDWGIEPAYAKVTLYQED
jgi:hypothetical protein